MTEPPSFCVQVSKKRSSHNCECNDQMNPLGRFCTCVLRSHTHTRAVLYTVFSAMARVDQPRPTGGSVAGSQRCALVFGFCFFSFFRRHNPPSNLHPGGEAPRLFTAVFTTDTHPPFPAHHTLLLGLEAYCCAVWGLSSQHPQTNVENSVGGKENSVVWREERRLCIGVFLVRPLLHCSYSRVRLVPGAFPLRSDGSVHLLK